MLNVVFYYLNVFLVILGWIKWYYDCLIVFIKMNNENNSRGLY